MEDYKQLLTKLNETIWDYAELKFCEHHSAQAMADVMRDQGFEVEMGLAGMDTARWSRARG